MVTRVDGFAVAWYKLKSFDGPAILNVDLPRLDIIRIMGARCQIPMLIVLAAIAQETLGIYLGLSRMILRVPRFQQQHSLWSGLSKPIRLRVHSSASEPRL